ncbi:MAG: hypothetical protein J6T80_00225 [Paludibacteraceae bacterium]|nr:hypothetical protein [Paludibacteraceae bacterium]
MNKKILIIGLLALLPLALMAQEEGAAKAPAKSKSGVFTGFSGGMMLHGGYLFADDPSKVFSNTGLGSAEYIKGLPKAGWCYGLGGSLRVHLINHIHIGAEGFVSTMPLMKTGSNVRTGWGGALCDFYGNWGKVRPMIGLTLGGGSMKRLYVPDQSEGVHYAESDSTHYNASYTKTPFFFVDPYVGMEIDINSHMAVILRIDYMLPFGTSNTNLTENVAWSKFMSPSGPRLYIGVMFGQLKRE